MPKRRWKIFHALLPYCLITAGMVLIVIIPLDFYSDSNLDVPLVSAGNPVEKSSLSEIKGGDKFTAFPESKPITPIARDNQSYQSSLTAQSALVIDDRSKKILFSKNEKETRPLASITKLMSAVTLLDFPIDWTATTSISQADGNGDQLVELGEVYTLDDLWHSALIGSSNKAVRAIVRANGLNSDEFINRMNKKAQDLGLDSLHFSEPTGLSDKNVGNAKDTADLLREALRFEKIYTVLQTREHYARPLNKEKAHRIWSTNWLLNDWVPNDFYIEDMAGKTGYITESDYNFVVAITNHTNGRRIIVAVLGAATNEKRFEEARDLAEWAFAHYVWPEDEDYKNLVE